MINDGSTVTGLVIYCDKYVARPISLNPNATVYVQGMFKWYQPSYDPGYWEVMIRPQEDTPGTDDKVEIIYNIVNVSALVSNPEHYEGQYVRVEYAVVTGIDEYLEHPSESAKFDISDYSNPPSSLPVYCDAYNYELYAERPELLRVGETVHVQGEMFYYAGYYGGYWEIKVRRGTNDSVKIPTLEEAWCEHLVLSELLYDPAGSDTGKEWIELYNPTAYAVNLSGWMLEHWDGESAALVGNVTLPLNASIPGYGFYLIGASADPANITPTPDYVPDYWFTDYGLHNGGNGGDAIRLKDSTGVVIDTLGYGSGTISNYPEFFESSPASDPAAGKSLERKPGFNEPASGNGLDTNNNNYDFIECSAPTPQNTSSATECPSFAKRQGVGRSAQAPRTKREALPWAAIIAVRGLDNAVVTSTRASQSSHFTSYTRLDVVRVGCEKTSIRAKR